MTKLENVQSSHQAAPGALAQALTDDADNDFLTDLTPFCSGCLACPHRSAT